MGHPAEALKEIGAHLAQHPDDANALRWAARAQLDLGDLPAAETTVRAALAHEPDDEWGLRLLAAVLRSTGRAVESVPVAQDAVHSSGGTTATLVGLAQSLRAAARPLAALGVAKIAVVQDPDEAEAMLALALGYLATDDRERAVGAIGSVLATQPDHPTAVPLMAGLDRAGSRWALARLTARVTADPAARAELRREVVDALFDARTVADTLPPLVVVHRRRGPAVDDSALVSTMVAAGDPDAARWLSLGLHRRFALAVLLTTVLLFGSWLPEEWRWLPVSLGLIVLPTLALVRTAAAARSLRGPTLRPVARRTLLSVPFVVGGLGCGALVALGVVGLIGRRSADLMLLGGSLGALLLGLFLLLTVPLHPMRTFAEVIPDARPVVSAFTRIRAFTTALVLIAGGVAAACWAVRDGGTRGWLLVAGAAGVLGVAAAGVALRPRTRLESVVTRQLAATTLRWPLIGSALAVPVLLTPLHPPAAVVGVPLVVLAALFGPWLMWTRALSFLPGYVGAPGAGRPRPAPAPASRRFRRSLHRWLLLTSAALLVAALFLVATVPDPANRFRSADAVMFSAVLLAGAALIGALGGVRVITRLPAGSRRLFLSAARVRTALGWVLGAGVVLPLVTALTVLLAPFALGGIAALIALLCGLAMIAASVTFGRVRAALEERVRVVGRTVPTPAPIFRRAPPDRTGPADEELLTTWTPTDPADRTAGG
ncbi:tetratricopeptide repeat protein [Nakamurella flavida]|uniref:Tetratricopeptide repeat protein n=1 Tax=Nakamurella flavida TaxID=363630 RepID=A0A939C377_9ACTN|nr:tetratricopeptide repeat protein [Nakamurella flavida]MBM9477345.1 tetratricopeptide repeat protein [Nakamurella flavida]MDP9777277.1 tetratricopeptide (TPR) repeat protein [Nakamurella flavida]